MDGLIQLGGVLLVCLALADLYVTVLYARGDVSLLTRRLNHLLWLLLQSLDGVHRGIGAWVLSFVGSLLLIADIAVWGVLLVVGFALVIWPELGGAVQATGEREVSGGFVTALYYAGYSLTTLGTGDLVPRTGLFRLLMVLKAALGFSFVTLSLTYLVSVYDTLRRRNAFALLLHHSTSNAGDASVLLAQLMRAPVPAAVQQNLTTMSSSLAQYYEDHHFYPILHYYRFHDRHYAMARILYIALDTATLVRAVLDEREYRWLVESSALETLWQSGLATSRDLAREFLPPRLDARPQAPEPAELRDWQQHFDAARARFEEAGIACRRDVAAAREDYLQQRQEWNATVRAFALFMRYDWREIARTA